MIWFLIEVGIWAALFIAVRGVYRWVRRRYGSDVLNGLSAGFMLGLILYVDWWWVRVLAAIALAIDVYDAEVDRRGDHRLGQIDDRHDLWLRFRVERRS